jgi:hypothetical protein
MIKLEVLDLKIVSANYENKDFKTAIEIKVCMTAQDGNIGRILERYREMADMKIADDYYNENVLSVESFFNKKIDPFENFLPEAIIVFYPLDEKRKKILTRFRDKITTDLENIVDYSDRFYKADPTKSIKKYNLSAVDFVLSVETPIKKLLVIDDVIDEGKTLNILLDKLFENNLIDDKAEIKMACIYNNPKRDERMGNPLKGLRDMMNL